MITHGEPADRHATRCLGIDLGTSSVKAVVDRPRRNRRRAGRRRVPGHHPQPGWSETRPADWLTATAAAVRAAVAAGRARVRPASASRADARRGPDRRGRRTGAHRPCCGRTARAVEELGGYRRLPRRARPRWPTRSARAWPGRCWPGSPATSRQRTRRCAGRCSRRTGCGAADRPVRTPSPATPRPPCCTTSPATRWDDEVDGRARPGPRRAAADAAASRPSAPGTLTPDAASCWACRPGSRSRPARRTPRRPRSGSGPRRARDRRS